MRHDGIDAYAGPNVLPWLLALVLWSGLTLAGIALLFGSMARGVETSAKEFLCSGQTQMVLADAMDSLAPNIRDQLADAMDSLSPNIRDHEERGGGLDNPRQSAQAGKPRDPVMILLTARRDVEILAGGEASEEARRGAFERLTGVYRELNMTFGGCAVGSV